MDPSHDDAPRRVIVTGAHGWLGSCLIARLSELEFTVEALARQDCDLAVPGAFARRVRDGSTATVVHLAASLDRSDGESAEDRQWRDTFVAGRHVIREAVSAGVTHIIAAGSMDELGSAEGVLSTARSPRPESIYGLCKGLVREVATFEARRGRLRVDWFRPTIVYGPGQRGSMLIPTLCQAAARGVAVEVSDGEQQRDFLFVDDLVTWICMALEQSTEGFHLHHLGSGTPVRVGEVIDRVEAAFEGARFLRGGRPRRSREPEVQVAPPNGTSVTGWNAAVSLSTGLERTIEWWRAQDV